MWVSLVAIKTMFLCGFKDFFVKICGIVSFGWRL